LTKIGEFIKMSKKDQERKVEQEDSDDSSPAYEDDSEEVHISYQV
jgi:hypothetical protein